MKKILNSVGMAAIVMITLVACEDKPNVYEFPVSKYFYEIPDEPVKENYVVGVPYEIRTTKNNMWMDNNKHLLYTGTPLLGEYDMRKDIYDNNKAVLRQQMDYAKQAGIDFFVISWGGHGLNDTILSVYEELYKPGHPQVVIRFDPGYRFPKAARDTMQRNHAVMKQLMLDFDSLYSHVMNRDFGYKNKVNNNPVMAFCNFTNTAHITSIISLTQLLRDKVGNKVWIMGELGSNWTSPERWGYYDETTRGVVQPDTIKAFDAVYITDVATDNKDRFDGYYSFMDYNYKYWQERMPEGKEYIPMIFPAFDNLVNNPNSNSYLIPRYNDETGPYIVSAMLSNPPKEYNLSNYDYNPYERLANVAKRNVGPSRILLVHSWNNYSIGNTLEPTAESGTDYLEYTRRFFKKP